MTGKDARHEVTARAAQAARPLDGLAAGTAPPEPDFPRLEDLIAAIDVQIDSAAALPAARLGALAPRDEPLAAALSRYLLFSVAETRYAVAVHSVVEINLVPSITAVPNVPDWVRGVANLRGDIVSVVELRSLLGLPATEARAAQRIVVVRAGLEEVSTCLIVDAVHGMLRVEKDRIRAPRGTVRDRIAPYLQGIFEADGQLVAVLDLEAWLLSHEMQQFE